MEVGHIFKINEEEFCICNIKEINNIKVAYAITTDSPKNTKPYFFELIDDENGTKIREITETSIIPELFKLFII